MVRTSYCQSHALGHPKEYGGTNEERQVQFRVCHCMTFHHEMATAKSVLVLFAFQMVVVHATYNCSRPNMIIETYTYDFLRTFGKAATDVTVRAPKNMVHYLNTTLASRDTHRNITVWGQCQLNETENFCRSCLSVLLTNIYEMCCEQKSSWGSINLRTSCSAGYGAPDYVIPGWTDPGDLPKEIHKQPEPLNLNAAAHSLLPLISFPILIFNAFFNIH